MKYGILGGITFTLFQAVSAFILWCGGYNFDERVPALAIWVLFSIGIGALVAVSIVSTYDFSTNYDEE